MSLVRAKRGFVIFDRTRSGMPRRIKQGSILESSDPAVVGSPAQFESVDDMIVQAPSVERATAEPGERRAVTPKPEPDAKSDEGEKTAAKKDEKGPAVRTTRTTSTTGAKGKQDGEV